MARKLARMILVTLSMALLPALQAGAAETTLVSTDSETNDNFGGAVATDGATAIVGAADHRGVLADDGAVYAFARDGLTWGLPSRLMPDVPGRESRRFGESVAITSNNRFCPLAMASKTRLIATC